MVEVDGVVGVLGLAVEEVEVLGLGVVALVAVVPTVRRRVT